MLINDFHSTTYHNAQSVLENVYSSRRSSLPLTFADPPKTCTPSEPTPVIGNKLKGNEVLVHTRKKLRKLISYHAI